MLVDVNEDEVERAADFVEKKKRIAHKYLNAVAHTGADLDSVRRVSHYPRCHPCSKSPRPVLPLAQARLWNTRLQNPSRKFALRLRSARGDRASARRPGR